MHCTPMNRDDTLRELASHGTPALPARIYRDVLNRENGQIIDWHWHNELELVVVEEGAVEVTVEGEVRLTPAGCGALINSRAIHRFLSPGDSVMPNLLFAPEWLAPEGSLLRERFVTPWLERGPRALFFSPEEEWQARWLVRLRELCALRPEEDELYALRLFEGTLGLWRELWERLPLPSVPACPSPVAPVYRARLRIMMQFIADRFSQELTLRQIADAAAVSPSEALRCFRLGIQTTPVEYLNRCRLQYGRRLLLETEEPVRIVAERSGFRSTGYFDRMFRRQYGCTPLEARRLQSRRDML